MPEIAAGSLFDGRYQVIRRLGTGGMADVWLADDTHLQRQVALKVLHARFAQDREFVERFRREAESAAGLQHPNVVSVFDRGEVGGTYYIAMQYLEGHSLKQLIEAGLNPEQAVYLIRQVLEGARFAHRHGIVHRDLKPQNVIVDADGKATVTDFGIARAGVSEITQTGSVMGTPHYLSPEQAQGLDVTPVSDLYSIGVILYEALTGRVPFEGESAVAVAMKQISQTPQRPSSINPQVSPGLDAVVMRALEKDPGKRFQNADAFIAALDAAMKEPGAAAGDTAAFAALPPVVAVPVEEDELVAEEEEARRRRRRWIVVLLGILIGLLVGFLLTRDRTAEVEVPNVKDQQLSVAITLLQQKGLEVGDIQRIQRDVAENTVLKQDPAASPPDAKVSEDCVLLVFSCSTPPLKVDLTVSAGPGEARVPATAGMPQAKAAAELKDAGFEVALQRINSKQVETGLVIHSEPPAGTSATRGSSVTLVVSTGPKLAKVPVLVGAQRAVAEQQIRGVGLVPSVTERESSSPEGEVISQSPSAGTMVEPGSSVSIVVSAGEEKPSVPNVIGKLRREAVEAIRAEGLTPVVEEEETEVASQIGRVTDQFPPPGSEVDERTQVTLVVGKRAAQALPPESAEEE